jgi:hypothetical protein
MQDKRFICAIFVVLAMSASLFAQVQEMPDVEMPSPQFQDHGPVTPWFWIGVQTVFSGGYNMETTAAGFRNYGGDYYTYASFNLAFVDSHYQTPKFYEVPRDLDPDAWTGHFIMLNFTSRINSWDQAEKAIENNGPAWLAEITGKGFRIGFFTQAAELIGGTYDYGYNSSEGSRKAITKIYGGNNVLNLGEGELGKLYYEKSTDNTVTTYEAKDSGAIMYTGYEKKDLWSVYLTMLSEGNVNSNVTNGNNKGIAGVVDFSVTPLGVVTDESTPLTFGVSGNVIGGFGWKGTNENVGFGLRGDVGYYLGDNMVIAPTVAFDGKLNVDNKFFWKAGGGVTFQFSGMRWTSDDWGDLSNDGYPQGRVTSQFAEQRYENTKILKYAYAQVYGAYSDERAFNMLFRVEEPDGNLGFHDKLGAMIETRLYNLTGKDKNGNDKDMSWEVQGRVSWDLNVGQYLITPYLRGYYNSDEVVKARIGAYANFIPFTGFELAYTSANLNNNVKLPKPSYLNASYNSFFDAGRIELIVILKSDDIKPQVPKRMSDWNYPTGVQHY